MTKVLLCRLSGWLLSILCLLYIKLIGAVQISAGHGRPGRVKDATDRRQQLQLLKKREMERGFERLPGDHTMQRFGKDF